jgi:hypothetical protein
MAQNLSRLEAGFIEGEPEQAFVEEAHRILLAPRPPSADSSAVADRKRLMEFIALTTDYLDRLGGDERLFNKLMTYYAGLRDLDLGLTAPFLVSREIHNAPPLSSEIWRLRATLAVALDYLVIAGEPMEKAASRVARTKGIERLLSAQAKDAKTSVKKWRGELRRGNVKSEVAKIAWCESRKRLAELKAAQALKAEAAQLLAQARTELVR